MQKVPKIITSTTQFQNPEAYQNDVQQLRSQMKTFMKDIKSQFSTIVYNYEKQISQLKMESQILKKSRNRSVTTASPYKKTTSFIIGHDDDMCQSHILPLKTNEFHRTSDSPFYRTERKQNSLFPSWGSAFEIRNTSPRKKNLQKKNQQNNFPEELITQQFDSEKSFQRSRYQRQSERKRQRQEEIVHCLYSHKKNLNEMTNQMMHLIGKTSKQQNDSVELQSQNEHEESQLKQQDDHHNRSLSQICDSLDHSFVSKKARKSKLKKKKVDEQAKKKKQQMESINQKVRKQRALKNLLQRLRQNANSTNAPQIVKASKLIPTGPRSSIVFRQQTVPVRLNSKVMINPNPVHSITGKMQESSPSFADKRPTSILKQSSNILTRSISGISAISFQE